LIAHILFSLLLLSGSGGSQAKAPVAEVKATPAAMLLEITLERKRDGKVETMAAGHVFDNGDLFAPNATRNVAGALEAWVLFVEAGMMAAAPFEVRARVEAATDLMDQVQQLIDTPGVHYAAPVVLAGAGLEEFLRSRVIALGLSPSGKPGIQAYADALRGAQDLTSQEVKSITAWAGQRNDAAHGTFEGLSKQRSQIMADGINLFLSTKGT